MQDEILWYLDLPRQRKKSAGDPVLRQMVDPRSLRQLILRSYHDNNFYVAGEKMYNTIRQKYYWPNLYVDVFEQAKTCFACQTGKGRMAFKAPLKPISLPTSIFDVWHLNHVFLPTSKNYKYALVLVDSLSL